MLTFLVRNYLLFCKPEGIRFPFTYTSRNKHTFKECELAQNDHPSPSGHPYFDNPKNAAEILKGVKQAHEGKIFKMTREERKKMPRSVSFNGFLPI